MTVTELRTRPAQLNQETIELLQTYLDDAKAGRILAVALAAVCPDGASNTASSGTDHLQLLLGALSILQHRMLLEAHPGG